MSDALAAFESFDFALATAIRFPENQRVLCLRPEPDEPFRAMTAALVAAFPEHQPYGGKYADPIPHATVAVGDDAVLDPIERELADALPIAARATEAVADGARRARPSGGRTRGCRSSRRRLARSSAGARSTSPAPIVSSTSPGSARRARYADALLDGRHPRREHAAVRERVDDELARSRPSTGSSRAA